MTGPFRISARSLGFTLVELLIVIIVIAVLAAIAIPKFVNSSERSKEAALRADLKLVRDAIERFQIDTDTYPLTMDSLSTNILPTNGRDTTGASKPILSSSWQGPYLRTVPSDAVSGLGLTYSITQPTVGQVNSSASGNDSDGNPFAYY